jgi:type IX secretion system PorP/SprF family membrane protein
MTPTYHNLRYKQNIIRCFYLIFSILMLITETLRAQDTHFSQFYTTPLLTNPTNTGMTDGSFRFANNYRNQWSKIGIPYKTLYTSFDSRIGIAGETFGIGGSVVQDQSSAYNLLTDQFLFSMSYSRIIHNHQFTVGLQPGFVYRTYNSGITFGNQFDPTSQQYNSNLPNSENGLANNVSYFDLNAGIYWRTLIRDIMPMAGFSISHINRPLANFSSASSSRLPMKMTFNAQVNIPLSSRFNVLPSLLYSTVPGTDELLLGGIEGYTINNFLISAKKIFAVTLVRVNPFHNFDAIILGGGINFSKFDIGITYDFNISPLSQVSNFNGAFEVSLVYTGAKKAKKHLNEPCFIY